MTLDAYPLHVSPLPAFADSACLVLCGNDVLFSLSLAPSSLPSHPLPSSHRPCVTDSGRLSPGGATNPGGRGLVRMSYPAPGQQKRRFSEWHMDLPLHHRCSTAGFWELLSCSFRGSLLVLSLIRTASAWNLALTLKGPGKLNFPENYSNISGQPV